MCVCKDCTVGKDCADKSEEIVIMNPWQMANRVMKQHCELSKLMPSEMKEYLSVAALKTSVQYNLDVYTRHIYSYMSNYQEQFPGQEAYLLWGYLLHIKKGRPLWNLRKLGVNYYCLHLFFYKQSSP